MAETDSRKLMNGKPVFTVPAKTVINFDSRFDKKLLCDGITFTAGNACVYDCAFCYVDDMQRKARAWHERHGVVYPPEGHLGVVIRIANAVELARKQILGKPEAFRMAKKIIYSSPKVDVAGNMELVRETVEICKVILELTNWDIRLLSKSNLLPKVALELENYFSTDGRCSPIEKIYPKKRIIYGVSTGTLDDKLAAAFEQGTPKVSKRIESLHWLQDNGFRTFGMICPSLPTWMPGHEDFDGYVEFSRQICAAIRVEKCEHIWAEVINLRGDSFTKTEAAVRNAGYGAMADGLHRLTIDKEEWEQYARNTFEAHAKFIQPSKLRFLQYVTKDTRDWWAARQEKGAVLL